MWSALFLLHFGIPDMHFWLVLVQVHPCREMACLLIVGLCLGVFRVPHWLALVLLGDIQDSLPCTGILLFRLPAPSFVCIRQPLGFVLALL